ncbi:MAG: Wzy polymerase domain-containing protein [Acidovorax soli]|uniref:PglL family O-oligosaccharyltransferase n=1 Tax=Acidovorax soli TaxID=592050 RepID=UPI0026EC2082|nr:O-antigen ligase family protein [Acidovorax soli]MCM2345800.1 Wzy polymerase domain-containing protein [Acidovorax soli]
MQAWPGLSFTQPLALPFNPWWLLWVVAIAGAWLLPTHFIPWGAFHADLLMTLALLPAAFWVALRTRRPLPLNTSVLVALCTACVPLLQFAFGMIHFAGDAWITSSYLFGFALALLIGARFEQLRPGQLLNALFAAIGAAAVLSTGIILYQWLGLSGLGLLTLHFPTGYRPFANLGQPNNLATLLVWGLIALWWGYLSGRVRGWITVGAAAFVMFGIAATQSRTAWLEIIVLGVSAALYRRHLASHRYAGVLLALGAFFVLLVLGWGELNHALHMEAAREVSSEMSSPGVRPAAWQLFLDALTLHPWQGWGWNQLSIAQSAVAISHPSLGSTFQSAHNLVIDLLVQNGVVLGTSLVLLLGIWLTVKALRVNTAQSCLQLFAIGVLLVHSLLEFPHEYLYFLLPVGLMMGTLDVLHPCRMAVAMPRWVAVILLCLGAGLTAWIAVEYNMAERSLERVRFERNRVGPSRNSKAPDLVMLTQLREFLRFLRLPLGVKVTPQQLDTMRIVTERFPSEGNHLVFAVAAGLSEQPEVARDALVRMCRIVPKEVCRNSLVTWKSLAAASPELLAVEMPPLR